MADEKLRKDPVAMQEALEKLHPQYVQRMNSLLKEQQESVRQDLSTAGLPQNELEKIMSKFVDNMATVDRLMGEQFARQSLALQERLAKRQRLAGEHTSAQNREEEEVEERMNQQHITLDKLCQDTKLLDKQRDSIWAQYQSDMQRVEENYNADLQVQQDMLKEKLQQRRQHKLQKLAAKEETEREDLNNSAAEGQTDPKDFVKAQHDLMIQQQQRRLNILEELDETEAEELSMLKQQLDTSRGQLLLEHDQSLYENLQARAQLSEKEARKLMKKHQIHMKNFQERQDEERERQREQLDAKLAQRRRKMEEQSATTQAEQKMLNDQQERAITMLLDTQAGLTEEARKQIMKEHEQNMIAVNNQLQISRTRQQKILEQKLAQRRAKLEAKTKAKQDEKKMLEEEYEEMVQQLEEERQQALTELRKRLAEETDQALKAQDEQLGKVIARLQLGQARRQSIIRRQEKAIKELQEQLVDKVAESGQVSDTKTERILQNHYREVELINEQLQTSKERQMRALQEKLEVKQLNRQRAIEEKLDKEEKEQLKYEARRGSLSASAALTKLLMDRRHQAAIDDLEREMKLELTRQTDQLNQELEEQMRGELEDREKDLLSKLAVMGNMSKKQLTEAVEEAVEKVGGTADAKKLTKDLAKRMKRPGTAGVGAERDEDIDDYRFRPKTATGDGYDDGVRPGRLPKLKKKKPKKAFTDDYDDE
ncbi:interaptin-like isoform X1 [Branchiostoma floridae]|uniref:Interaptin-like isoform X1 n=1 Tax=Branchiostoma floridae TaxID=7739 RepID=A0A9J7L258_BRAFL|nr:interaptin-like isoform X1 [Branchiostoma floridae]